ncbi:protein-S-isoprenylcysteine O-methyltransferase [Nostoc sp. 106C]|uniref:protein-S-isoprenylcysteine O-methyltransferase n=1 Tax=Nostoc sp. 106C TaxID=1932667 RepID=UPI000A3B92E9|nr:protein-S-isoprenylcysteine O-methyltransferase [Nostoc sp. 106C]OUL23547.1 protein-S-isoprenylcysteine methyltransferase [Nostoc sp. 106C]
MSEITRKLVFLICFIAIYTIRLYFKQQVSQKKITESRKTTQEKVLLFLAFIGIFILPLIGIFTPWLEFAAYNLPDWTGWIGTAVFVTAIWLFWRSHADLGLNWSASLEIHEHHSLIDTGVYRYIRHPMYASFLLWGIAQALLLHNWIYGLFNILSFLPMYFLRVYQEEQMMLDTFGEKYRNYMSCTGRVIPKFTLRATPLS